MDLLIIDSSAEVMERLHELLSEEASFCTIHRAYSCEEAANVMRQINLAVILMDSTLYKCSQGGLLRKMIQERSSIAFIVLSNGGDDFLFSSSRRRGRDFLVDKYDEFE